MKWFAFSLLLFTYILLNLIQRPNFEFKSLTTQTHTKNLKYPFALLQLQDKRMFSGDNVLLSD